MHMQVELQDVLRAVAQGVSLCWCLLESAILSVPGLLWNHHFKVEKQSPVNNGIFYLWSKYVFEGST